MNKDKIKTEDAPDYQAFPPEETPSDAKSHNDEIIKEALAILDSRIRHGVDLNSPTAAKDYLRLKMSHYEREVFALLLLDNKHRVIEFINLFVGTLSSASVYPREVVKVVLQHNAAAVMLAHNHISHDALEPSQADKAITERLIKALELIDVRVIDHIIVANTGTSSFAEMGLL